MLPHGGTGSRIWREVCQLGADLAALREVRGSRVAADVAVLWDWQSWWALELEWRPSVDLSYRDTMASWYERLWRAHLTVDFARPDAPLDGYPLVVVPSLYLMSREAAANLAGYAARGGTVVVSYFSGIVDPTDTVHPGGYPGGLRELLGLTVEEFLPLRADGKVTLDGDLTGDVWAEDITLHGATAQWRYRDGPAAGRPAVTRHGHGTGTAWYVSTRLRGGDLDAVLRRAYADAGLPVRSDLPDGVELVRRVGSGVTYLIAINHTDRDATVPGQGVELLTGAFHAGELPVPAGEVRVLRES
jgi:beta-galactosidase